MIEDVRLFLEPQLGFLAKSSGEPLWMHHFTVYKVCMRLLEMLPTFPQELVVPLQLACLIHDMGKMREDAQAVLSGEKEGTRVKHKLKYEEVYDYIINAHGLAVLPSDKQVKAAYDIAVTHHSVSDEDVIKNSTTYSSSGVLLLRVSDWLASMDGVDVGTIERINAMFTVPGSSEPLLHLTYFEIGREPGPSTSIIATKTLEAFEELGYFRLVLFSNAAVVAKTGKATYPDPKGIAKKVYRYVVENTMKNISPDYGTDMLLIGFSAEFPDDYLVIHKARVTEDLANVEMRARAFFKLLSELMKLHGCGPSSHRNNWQMNVVHGVVIGRSAISKAAKEWALRMNYDLPKRSDGKVERREALSFLMDKLTLKDLLNEDVRKALEDIGQAPEENAMGKELSGFKAEELYDFLLALACAARREGDAVEERLKEIIAMISFPVETDFQEIATQRLQAYKRYKKNPDYRKGCCEMCGSAFTQKLGQEAPDGFIQCFSYVKSQPTSPRAVCYLCAFDLSLVRSGKQGGVVSTTLWITSKVEVGLEEKLFDLVKRIEDGFLTPRRLKLIVSPKDDMGLPLPAGLKLPLPKGALGQENDIDKREAFLYSPFGIFASLESARGTFSLKNQRAVYAPLYDLMSLLGFGVCITNDLEFRYGLFGEKRVATLRTFYDAVSVLLLAKTLASIKRNPHCFAAGIIANQPSLAIGRSMESDEKGKPLLEKEQLSYYLQALLRADRPILKGGMITMGDLLKDAAFFARNIPKYCVEPEARYDFRKNLTKHKATKAVQAPLNEMMLGRDFDTAMAKLLAQLSVKIGKEERKGMDEFVRRSKEILMRYFKLRQESFSDFLKAKNALMNGIYAFTRYEDLDMIFKD
ncbi:MAG: HD domain-containing protein [Actinobacteria bacterium]|nr:HD domain-containing protein [Actinomycetota bacterium]